MGQLHRVVSAQSDGSGNLSMTFPPVPFARVWTGTLRITVPPGSSATVPASSSWVGLRNGIDWGGTQVGGGAGIMEGTEGDTISVQGSGFTPTTTYVAAWEGNDIAASEVPAFQSPFPGTTH